MAPDGELSGPSLLRSATRKPAPPKRPSEEAGVASCGATGAARTRRHVLISAGGRTVRSCAA